MDVVLITVLVVIGIVCTFTGGFMIGRAKYRPRPIGNLRVDRSDSDGPYLFLELENDPGDISRLTYAIFKVDVRDYISHK